VVLSYRVLARKWRPKTFRDLVGQPWVVKALENALTQGRLHHAYLFTGTRGVGKTTIARIFAKSLNCEQGITANPCGVCHHCMEIDQGTFVDLLEIDAASRTKVDDTREILDNVQYRPARGRFKIYLIDEVHMLSTHSFNALLKTLEEPPSHVKFLLATTDPQKIPPTVLSRCIQFVLRSLSEEAIAEYLALVLSAEGVTFEPEAMHLLAHAAFGSVRDALSLTDQAIALGGGQVAVTDIQAMLGTVDRDRVMVIWQAVVDHDLPLAFSEVQKLAQMGVNFAQLIDDLLEVMHSIALLQAVPSLPKVMFQEAVLKEYAQRLPPDIVQSMYQTALYAKRDYIYASSAQSGFEMFLIRLSLFCAAPKGPAVKKKVLTSVESPSDSAPSVSPVSAPLEGSATASAPPVVSSASMVSSVSMVSSTPGDSSAAGILSAPTVVLAPTVPSKIPVEALPKSSLAAAIDLSWETILSELSLDISTYSVAEHLAFIECPSGKWLFYLHPKYQLLWDKARAEKVKAALAQWCEKNDQLFIQMMVEFKELEGVLSPYAQKEVHKREKIQAWEKMFQEDSFVKELSSRLGANWDVSAITTAAITSPKSSV
jgi:DNA polymerase III subunit gamma/tau